MIWNIFLTRNDMEICQYKFHSSKIVTINSYFKDLLIKIFDKSREIGSS